MRSVVVLPAPFEPMSATSSPSPTRERDALERADVAVRDLDVGQLKQHGGLPEVRRDDLGVGADRGRRPSAIDPAVVEDLDAVAQVHDQRDVVGDEDDRDRPARRGCAG